MDGNQLQSGIALNDAGIGERVRVRVRVRVHNEASKRVIEGTVIDQHRVEVRP